MSKTLANVVYCDGCSPSKVVGSIAVAGFRHKLLGSRRNQKGEMKDIDQHIALCEWAGWKRSPEMDYQGRAYGGYCTIETYTNGLDVRKFIDLPDTNSLDVLHEMEKRLTNAQQTLYMDNLLNEKSELSEMLRELTFAAAVKRRIALLKTLNLWREDSNEVGK